MPLNKIILTGTQTTGEVTGTTYGSAISLDGAKTFSVQCNVTVDTPGNKSFLSGVAALLVVQNLTYTAVLRGVAGNSITIAYVAGGTAGAEVVTVTGNAISVSIDVTPVTGSSANQIKTAVLASAPAIALIGVTGSSASVQAAASATPLATGVNSAVVVATDRITITAHGYTTGDKVQATTDGTLPAGLTTSTDYFVIAIDANTIQLASSLANALAGTQIDLTNQGSSGATNNIVPTALAGATVKLQKSNDGTNWSDEGSATSITATSLNWLEKADPTGIYMRLAFTVTAGQLSSSNVYVVKGPN